MGAQIELLRVASLKEVARFSFPDQSLSLEVHYAHSV
jgi:hypothetical protein